MFHMFNNDRLQPSIDAFLGKAYQFHLRVSWLIAIVLFWSFIVRDYELPVFQEYRIFIAAFLILFSYWLYRHNKLSVCLSVRYLVFFGLIFITLCLISSKALFEPLACDELYHAEQSLLSLQIFLNAANSLIPSSFIRHRPVSEFVSALNVILALGIILISYALVKFGTIKNRIKTKYLVAFIFLIGIGYIFSFIPGRLEVHPPLRLLPLFISQILFGFDDLSFRLAGICLLSFVLSCVGVFIYAQTSSYLITLFSIILISCMPLVLHVASIIQPSIWAFCAWVTIFLFLVKIDSSESRFKKVELLQIAGVFLGCFCLARPNALVLWFPIVIYLFLLRPSIKNWFATLFPACFVLPVLYISRKQSHAALNESNISNAWLSIQSGIGPITIINSTTVIWILIILILVIFSMFSAKPRMAILSFLLALIPAYVLYFMIWPYLWGIGRYLAEFIGGFAAVLIINSAIKINKNQVSHLLLPIFLIISYSVYTFHTLNHDVFYDKWPQRKITTESIFPYRESLGFLQRQCVEGKFCFIGGVPIYGDLVFYLRGFNYNDVTAFRARNNIFTNEISKISDDQSLVHLLEKNDIKWLVVQYGDKREWQHRSPELARLYAILSKVINSSSSNFNCKYQFLGKTEGAIDLYKISSDSQY